MKRMRVVLFSINPDRLCSNSTFVCCLSCSGSRRACLSPARTRVSRALLSGLIFHFLADWRPLLLLLLLPFCLC